MPLGNAAVKERGQELALGLAPDGLQDVRLALWQRAKPRAVDLAPWVEAAALLVPLARSEAAAAYSLPAEFGPHAGRLPGAVTGMQSVGVAEPECKPLACTTAAPIPAVPVPSF